MAASINRIPDRDRQEVRYAHHVVYRIQHVDDDTRPLPADQIIYGRLGASQSDIHSHIFFGMSAENIRTALLLFQRTMESVRFRRSHIIIGR